MAFEESVAIHESIVATYVDLGYRLVELPHTTPAERELFATNLLREA